MDSFSPVLKHNPSVVLNIDASLGGWGASMAGSKIGWLYSPEEYQKHINILERKTALLGLKAFNIVIIYIIFRF